MKEIVFGSANVPPPVEWLKQGLVRYLLFYSKSRINCCLSWAKNKKFNQKTHRKVWIKISLNVNKATEQGDMERRYVTYIDRVRLKHHLIKRSSMMSHQKYYIKYVLSWLIGIYPLPAMHCLLHLTLEICNLTNRV